MYNIFVRSRGWLSLASCALTLLGLLVTVTDSQSVSEAGAWPYYYAPAFSHSDTVVLQTPYHYLGANRDHRILNIFKKGAGPQLVIRQKQTGHGHGHGWGHGWGHGGGGEHKKEESSSSGGLLKGWLPKKSFGVHVTGGLGFSFGGKKEEKKKESHHGWSYPTSYGWGSYHGHQQHKGWGSYHRPSHGWGSYHHSPHGQHSYGWGGYDDEYSHDDTERSAISVLDEEEEDELEAEERADIRPRLLLIDNLYEDEDEPEFVYSPDVDEYY